MIRQILSLIACLLIATSMVAMQQCCICEGMRQEAFVTLTCNHTYHPSCILFIASATNKCPQCNHSISAEQKAALEAVKPTFCQSRPKVYRTYQKCFICDDRIPGLQLEDLVILNCDHAYHPTCILAWSITNPSCPQCKHPISQEQQAYFGHITHDDIPTPGPDTPPQKHSFMSTYKTRIIISCCGITGLICYYYQNDIMAWFKNSSHKQQELL